MNIRDLAQQYSRRFEGKLQVLRRALFSSAAEFTPDMEIMAKKITEAHLRDDDRQGLAETLGADRRKLFPSAGPFRSAVTAHSALHLVAEMTPWAAVHPGRDDVSSYVMVSVSARHPLTDSRQTPDPDDAAALVVALVGDRWGQQLYDVGHLSRSGTGATHYFQLFINPEGSAVPLPEYAHDLPRRRVFPEV